MKKPKKTKKKIRSTTPPDGRGKRPKDPNALALWIVNQSTVTHPVSSKHLPQ